MVYDVVDRDCFYQAACNATKEAVLGLKRARAIRQAERMALMQTLVRFGLAQITRGGVPIGLDAIAVLVFLCVGGWLCLGSTVGGGAEE
jgi:hypothetical protein